MFFLAESMVLKNTQKIYGKFEKCKEYAENNKKLIDKFSSEDKNIEITFRNFALNKDEKLLANMQNDFFNYGELVTKEAVKERFASDYTMKDLAFFLCVNNEPVGYGQIIKEDNINLIGGVGILSEYRGCGLGKLMMMYLIDKGIEFGMNSINLYVVFNNHIARTMYRNLGFKHRSFTILYDTLRIPYDKIDRLVRIFKRYVVRSK